MILSNSSPSEDRLTAEIADRVKATTLRPLAGGRTNRVWQDGTRVIKLYSGAATPLFANSAEAEWRCITHLAGTGLAPDPLERMESARGTILIYTHVPGTPTLDLETRLTRLDHLHAIAPPEVPPVATGAAVLAQGTAMLRPADPLHARRPPPPPTPQHPVFLHRDAVATNAIGTRLIDWQAPGIGDPLEDHAHAASPAMAALYGGDVSGYEMPKEAAAYHWRMACYCQWQVDRGNTEYGPARDAELTLL